MAASFSPKLYLVIAKIETTQFTDPVPTPAANAMLVSNLKITPLKVDTEDRNLMLPYYGSQVTIPVNEECMISFDVEMAASGTAGTAPAWGPLVRACGMAEVLVAVTSATYNPISAVFESITLYCYRNGILYKFLGCRGTFKLGLTAKKIPKFSFTFTGKYTPVTDAAIPGGSVFTAFQVPKASIPTWLGTTTFAGVTPLIADFQLDIGNDIAHVLWMNAETNDILDRSPKGSMTVQAVTVATLDYFGLVRNATQSAFSLVHGTTAGNKTTIAAPKLQLTDVQEVEFNGALAFQFGTVFTTNAGNDEVTIACT